jgi:tRNA threonylcarbamoyladenosine biosynthesis protein TsaE
MLAPGDLVTVSGELGSGKTTFVRGAVRALGVAAPVTSPTYTIGHRYGGVSHLDLYRLEQLDDADWGALEPYLDDAVCFVEWPERAAGWLPPERVSVQLRHLGSTRRLVVLESSATGLLEGVFGGVDSRS